MSQRGKVTLMLELREPDGARVEKHQPGGGSPAERGRLENKLVERRGDGVIHEQKICEDW